MENHSPEGKALGGKKPGGKYCGRKGFDKDLEKSGKMVNVFRV